MRTFILYLAGTAIVTAAVVFLIRGDALEESLSALLLLAIVLYGFLRIFGLVK